MSICILYVGQQINLDVERKYLANDVGHTEYCA